MFGVDATKTPVDDDICIVADPVSFGEDDGSDSGTRAAAGPPMYVVFVVKPKLASALVEAVVEVTTVLLPEGSGNIDNGCNVDC